VEWALELQVVKVFHKAIRAIASMESQQVNNNNTVKVSTNFKARRRANPIKSIILCIKGL
jgi:hypothetical protein